MVAIDDYSTSTSRDESTYVSGGGIPRNINDIPSAVPDPPPRENVVMNKLDELIELFKGNQERNEGSNTTALMVQLFQSNERLSAELVNCREENFRLRQECDALKANVELLKSEPEKKDAYRSEELERLSAQVTNGREENLRLRQDIELWTNAAGVEINRIKDLAKDQDEIKSSIAELQEKLAAISAKDQDENQASTAELQENLKAIKQENIEADRNNVDRSDKCNQDASVAPGMYTVPAQSPIFWGVSKGNKTGVKGYWHSDILDCPPLVFGKRYKWSMKVSLYVSSAQLGVFLRTGNTVSLNDLGDERGGWAYWLGGGEARCSGAMVQNNLPILKDATKLTFIFDLTGNGTLSVYHDDDETNLIELFINMKSSCPVSPFSPRVTHEFLPAASGTGVEFLGFEDQ